MLAKIIKRPFASVLVRSQPFSLEEFYGKSNVKLSDEDALKYMNFACKLALIQFKDDKEMLSYK
jgi:hypothetical protein